jgi:RNA polymerase sigma-70 factor (ECF subfamily)
LIDSIDSIFPWADDRASLERLFAQHRDYLKQVVRLRMDQRLQQRVDASDIVQETHLEALRRVDEYVQNPVMSLRLWLRQIACDRLVMAQREHLAAQKRSLNREICLPDDLSIGFGRQLVAGAASPSMALSKKEVARLVREAVAALEEEDREIVLLHSFEGLTSSESGELLGIEPAAARKRFGRALRKLQERLGVQGHAVVD